MPCFIDSPEVKMGAEAWQARSSHETQAIHNITAFYIRKYTKSPHSTYVCGHLYSVRLVLYRPTSDFRIGPAATERYEAQRHRRGGSERKCPPTMTRMLATCMPKAELALIHCWGESPASSLKDREMR